MSQAGKGDKPRPVDKKKYNENRIGSVSSGSSGNHQRSTDTSRVRKLSNSTQSLNQQDQNSSNHNQHHNQNQSPTKVLGSNTLARSQQRYKRRSNTEEVIAKEELLKSETQNTKSPKNSLISYEKILSEFRSNIHSLELVYSQVHHLN